MIVTTTMNELDTEKTYSFNKLETFLENHCVLTGIVTEEPYQLSDGKVLAVVQTYRPHLSKKDRTLWGAIIDTFRVILHKDAFGKLKMNDVVRFLGSFKKLVSDDVKYGFCPFCGAKQKSADSFVVIDCNLFTVVESGKDKMRDTLMDNLLVSSERKENHGFLCRVEFTNVKIKDVRPHESDEFGNITVYEVADEKNTRCCIFRNGITFDLFSRYKETEFGWQLKQKTVYDPSDPDREFFGGIAKSIICYPATFEDDQDINWCPQCGCEYSVNFPDVIFFVKEDPILL